MNKWEKLDERNNKRFLQNESQNFPTKTSHHEQQGACLVAVTSSAI